MAYHARELKSASTSGSGGPLRFQTTSWSLILRATTGDPAASAEAVARLFESYWPPVYAFIRRRGRSVEDAEDLAQAYFVRLIEKGYLGDFRREAGRFRSFLLASVSHFLANEWDRERAAKRGGGRRLLSLDTEGAEASFRREPADGATPERVFERQWVAATLARCLETLGEEQRGTGGESQFARLLPFLGGDGAGADYAAAARDLGIPEGTVRVRVHRLRKRFGAVLREEVGRTVADPAEVEPEIRWMLGILQHGSGG